MARETVKNKGKKGRTEIHRWLEGRERKARINSPPRVNSCRDETSYSCNQSIKLERVRRDAPFLHSFRYLHARSFELFEIF